MSANASPTQTQTQYLLDASRMPTHWYNIAADLPTPPPPVLHPGTLQAIGPDDLAPLFPMELILQEVSTEREIPIPEPVREVFKLWRPAPLFRARRLEKALGRPTALTIPALLASPSARRWRLPRRMTTPNTRLARC